MNRTIKDAAVKRFSAVDTPRRFVTAHNVGRMEQTYRLAHHHHFQLVQVGQERIEGDRDG